MRGSTLLLLCCLGAVPLTVAAGAGDRIQGIPALTLELGGPRGYEPDMVKAGVEGIDNVLAHYGVSGQKVGRTAATVNAFRGNALVDVVADTGGFVEYLVELNDEVKEKQRLAIQRNAFGDVVREYTATAAGRVAIRGTDAIRERGSDIATSSRTSPTVRPRAALTLAMSERGSFRSSRPTWS